MGATYGYGIPNPDEDDAEPMYRTTSLEEEKQIEEKQLKGALSDLQKQSLDQKLDHKYMSRQTNSSSKIPAVNHDSTVAKNWLRKTDAPIESAAVEHTAAPPIDDKKLRRTCENVSKFGSFMDALTGAFKKDKAEKLEP
jgi:hypothetical protein